MSHKCVPPAVAQPKASRAGRKGAKVTKRRALERRLVERAKAKKGGEASV